MDFVFYRAALIPIPDEKSNVNYKHVERGWNKNAMFCSLNDKQLTNELNLCRRRNETYTSKSQSNVKHCFFGFVLPVFAGVCVCVWIAAK